MRETGHWNSKINELKGSSESTVRHSTFHLRMREKLNLRNPRSNPKVRIIFVWDFEISQTPNNSAIYFFQPIVKCIYLPLAPNCNCSQTKINNRLIIFLCFFKPIKKFWVLFLQRLQDIILKFNECASENYVWRKLLRLIRY